MSLPQRLNELAQANADGLLRAIPTRYGKSSPPTPSKNAFSPTTPESATKRRFIPRLFGRKPDLPPLRIASSHANLRSPPHSPPPSSTFSPSRSSTVFSPSRSGHFPIQPPQLVHTPSSEDNNLISTKDIQSAILSLDSELRGLVDAFNDLEHAAVRRIKKRKARRLPANTPDSVDVLLEGREWREHRRIGPPRASPSTPVFQARLNNVVLEPFGSDGLSMHSGYSERTSFSFAPPISPISPTRSAHFRTQSSSILQRKNSVSSVSSKSGSLLSSSRLGVAHTGSSSISHSSSNLPLPTSRTLSSVHDDEDELEDLEDEDDQLSELHEIQQRRNEVISRYNRRMEYLKAKLKGAELREKLLRK